jgi:hypothetical protein
MRTIGNGFSTESEPSVGGGGGAGPCGGGGGVGSGYCCPTAPPGTSTQASSVPAQAITSRPINERLRPRQSLVLPPFPMAEVRL